ncbi:hypothetical protein L1987_68060 [Smallanthus sonchifolius]|uniref:Uncharacterized protein n=1 Tax=Smallanthus sonchifolius TaxID=185202 RepID=A0ACB9B851_9ASTR|nr:hypothetical protein L1987_68060 [Smallanthus sonchifolius]
MIQRLIWSSRSRFPLAIFFLSLTHTMVKLSNLPIHASRLFFVLIILQFPFFRIQCRSGMCTTPIHVTSSQLVASDIFPIAAIKALLYPGAVFNDIIYNMSVPSWNSVLDKYNLTDIKGASTMPDLQRLEVLAGSYFSVAGAFIGLLKPQRMSMFGTLLVIWGLVKEGLLGKPVNRDPTTSVYVYPTMLIAVLCAFSSVKYNFQKATKKPPPRPLAKPLKSSRKSKLK